MLLHILSDLHLEFETFVPPPTYGEVVILAGDIGTGVNGLAFAREQFPGKPVIYVAGNHEYYGHGLPALTERMRATAWAAGVHFLENDQVVIDGVRFLGTTLWTDFALFGPDMMSQAMKAAELCMNDYRRIHRGSDHRRLTPRDTLALHRRSRAWLRDRLAERFSGPTVVVTHHAPTQLSSQERFRKDLLTTSFISDLESMMGGDRVVLWIHGHTHHCVDFDVNGTRVVSNQRGYPGEFESGFQPDYVVEV
jgi:predicted phosphodiesterase